MSPSKIQWTEETWNPLAGCDPISSGCKNCYAATMAKRLGAMAEADIAAGRDPGGKRKYIGTAERRGGVDVFNGLVVLDPKSLDEPQSWKRPRTIFVNSMSDLFHKRVPDEYIDQVFAVMYECQWHTFQILTKRADRLPAYLNSCDRILRIAGAAWRRLEARAPEKAAVLRPQDVAADIAAMWPLKNVWLGVSIENQKRAEQRVMPLLTADAAVRFVSCEPLLSSIYLRLLPWKDCAIDAMTGDAFDRVRDRKVAEINKLDWVIAGGETGPRPCHPDDVRGLRDQCQATGTKFFFKQWGTWQPISTTDGRQILPLPTMRYDTAKRTCFLRAQKHNKHRLLDGREWNEMPSREVLI